MSQAHAGLGSEHGVCDKPTVRRGRDNAAAVYAHHDKGGQLLNGSKQPLRGPSALHRPLSHRQSFTVPRRHLNGDRKFPRKHGQQVDKRKFALPWLQAILAGLTDEIRRNCPRSVREVHASDELRIDIH